VRKRRLADELEVEDPAIELQRVLQVADLERDVVDPDEPWHGLSLR
jgi:hypothetical protein